MSVYIPRNRAGEAKSSYFHFDFKIKVDGRPRRFTGSTGQTTRRAAEEVERRQRQLAALGQLGASMTVGEACDRYWKEVSQHAPNKHAQDQAKHVLSELVIYYGETTPLVEITSDTVTRAMTARSATPVMYRGAGKTRVPSDRLPTPATVNRQVVEPLRRVLRRAKKKWGVPIDLDLFQWGGREGLKRKEPKERVRALSAEEELRFWQNLPTPYHGLAELYLISGKRQSIWIGLKKFQVDLTARIVRIPVLKQGAPEEEAMEMTVREFEIVKAAYDSSPNEYVFTVPFRATVTGKTVKPHRLTAVSKTMIYKIISQTLRSAGISNFRPHDLRHTFATRALDGGANLPALQAAMNHADLRSTMRYAHLTDAASAAKSVRASVVVSKQLPANVSALKRNVKK